MMKFFRKNNASTTPCIAHCGWIPNRNSLQFAIFRLRRKESCGFFRNEAIHKTVLHHLKKILKEKINIAKISVGIIFIALSFGFQSADNYRIEFTDKYGNEFKISSSELVFENLNSEFLKENLDGAYFVKNMANSEYDYNICLLYTSPSPRD